jgi:DNA-binding SARP family transcriptional activator
MVKMRAKTIRSSGSLDTLSPLYTLDGLLQTGKYEEIDQRLARLGDELDQGSLLTDVVQAARQLCQVCTLSRDTANWHRHASEEAAAREKGLAELLLAIHDTIVAYASGKAIPQPEPAIINSVALRHNGHDLNAGPSRTDGANLNLWQRIQTLLGREETALSSAPARSRAAPAPDGAVKPAESAATPAEETGRSALVVFCLGQFRVYLDDQLVENWPSRKYKSVFKYLAVHNARPVSKEVLMELFWPDSTPESARNNLNVVIYGLRQTLREIDPLCSHLLFQDDCYLFNPVLDVWVDSEAFEEHVKNAQKLESDHEMASAIKEFSAAEALYQGEFFEEDRYEEWLAPRRQTLQATNLEVLDRLCRYYLEQSDFAAAATMGKKILSIDPCHEAAHRYLMDCYYEQGQPHLALRQYHLCVEALQKELNLSPSPSLVERYRQIRANAVPHRQASATIGEDA